MYDYCGFSIREQKGMMNYMMGGGKRPKDEEVMKYIMQFRFLLRNESCVSMNHHKIIIK
jgi:hypothetical protein